MGFHTEAFEDIAEQIEEALTLAVIVEDGAVTGTPVHHVIPRTLVFESQWAGHARKIS